MGGSDVEYEDEWEEVQPGLVAVAAENGDITISLTGEFMSSVLSNGMLLRTPPRWKGNLLQALCFISATSMWCMFQ